MSWADLVVKEPGDEGHRLGGVGHEALQLHLYNKVYSTVCTVQYRASPVQYGVQYSTIRYSTVDVLTSLPSLTWMSGSPRMEAEGVTTTSRTRLQGAITHWAGTKNLCQPTRPFPYDLCISVPVYGQWVNAHSAWCLYSVLKGACNP